MDKEQARRGQAGGQQQDIPGNDFTDLKIVPFRPRVKPAPAPMLKGFDLARSRQIDLMVYAIEYLQEEKRDLEARIPTEQAI